MNITRMGSVGRRVTLRLVARADLLFLNPAMTTLGEYAKFKREKAQGIVIDETSSVDKADHMCV